MSRSAGGGPSRGPVQGAEGSPDAMGAHVLPAGSGGDPRTCAPTRMTSVSGGQHDHVPPPQSPCGPASPIQRCWSRKSRRQRE
ncbi:hypothetical protein F751_4873 [Auxenochlorella protothecoides]|uniref:Uncharacterized protein n=1 Tax=Auxenochlorella protothecoides TaxID=3075 RepID=A0A087SKX6_AUXPR|nr:hypothetical protein F751_4873 [Auxenochlorella protothecoides]KFM26380.1 hypothetical protein F751_4873 [Auxenochlorella protothecoides]